MSGGPMTSGKVAPASDRVRVRRQPTRGSYDRASVDEVLGAGLLAQVAFVDRGQPWCVPMLYARVGDDVYVHGSTASPAMRLLAGGAPAPPPRWRGVSAGWWGPSGGREGPMVAAGAARGLWEADLDRLGRSLAGGRKPKVVFTPAAGQLAGQTGQVVELADPALNDEW